MRTADALRLAHDSGVHIVVSGTDLVLDADREPIPAVLEALRRHKADIVAHLKADPYAWTPEDWRAFFDERAGMAEFDMGQPREQAEATAFEHCVLEWLDRHPCSSSPDDRVFCGGSDAEGHAVVPFGTRSQGHSWLHPGCWQDWYEGRRAKAGAALASMGIEILPERKEAFGKYGGD